MDYYPLVFALDVILILHKKKSHVESPNLFQLSINSIVFWYLIKKKNM